MYTFTFITLVASMLLHTSANPMPSTLIRRDPVDCSPHLLSPQEGYYTNCIQKEGHYMNPDGTCPPGTADTGCKSYCEVKRKAFLGKEQYGPGNSGSRNPANARVGLELSKSISVTKDFKAGLTAEYLSAITGSLSYQYTTTKTSSVTVSYPPPIEDATKDDTWSRWVFWPTLVESCGNVVEQKIDVSTAGCIGLNCMNTGQRTCKGKVTTKSNICVTSSVMSPDGFEVTVVFAQRFENSKGKVFPWDEQPKTYKAACPKGDPSCEAK